ncbi:MAG: polysaccharide deacetylase family protein [Acidobacteriota bacterium]
MAVTIDDLPAVCTCKSEAWSELTAGLLSALQKRAVPAIGFVNEGKLFRRRGEVAPEKPDVARVELLERWLDAGHELGNHSFSHPDLHTTALAEFQQDVLRGETVTRRLLADREPAANATLRYFRHPYLRTGRTLETKRQFESFLAERGYRVAPVSIDNAEWIYARAFDVALDTDRAQLAREVSTAYLDYMIRQTEYFEGQSRKLLGRELRQVLLLHANRLNAAVLGDLLDRLAERGYRFVPLAEALEDEAYRRLDEYTGSAGISWLQRWAWAEGHRGDWFGGEPEVDGWVRELSGL